MAEIDQVSKMILIPVTLLLVAVTMNNRQLCCGSSVGG
jgi:hypothetical protein